MRHFGVGARFTRNIWHFPDTYWQLTRYGDPPLVICISVGLRLSRHCVALPAHYCLDVNTVASDIMHLFSDTCGPESYNRSVVSGCSQLCDIPFQMASKESTAFRAYGPK